MKSVFAHKNNKMDMKVKLSTLWIVIMLNMIFADILSFMTPGFLEGEKAGPGGVQITQGLLLVFAILLEIPIIMVFLSRVLKYKVNRWVNIIASVITIVWVIAGGSTAPHYIFFAAIEVVCMVVIIVYALRWPKLEA
jgi:Sec-independent protein secretion pathway component TatC